MGGTSLKNLEADRSLRRGALLNTVFFIIGFSTVFIALGLLFTSTFVLLGGVSTVINIVAGIIVVVLGMNFIFDFWKVLNFEKRFHMSGRPTSAPASLIFGMAFGAGWSPCIGPILSSILFLAGSEGSVSRGILLLIVYSAGLGLPFLLTGIFLPYALRQLDRAKRHLPKIKVASGVFLVLIGAMIAVGRLQQFNVLLFSAAYRLESWEELNPIAARWLFSGLFYVFGTWILIPAIVAFRRDRLDGVYRLRLAQMIFVLLFIAAGTLSIFGVINVSSALSGWLNYQGI